MSLLTDPLGEFGTRARREPVIVRESGSEAIDAETLEMIQTFDAFYGEPTGAPAGEAAHAGGDAIEFPDDFQMAAQGGSHERAPDSRAVDDDLSIDDAFAVLRAAESKGRTLAGPHAPDPDEDDAAFVSASASAGRSDAADARVTAPHFEPGPSWSAKARAVWPKVLAAGAIALVVGVGLGYIAGHAPMPPSTYAKIEVSPAGGAQLRFDYELDRK